jgi:hypothetical protein
VVLATGEVTWKCVNRVIGYGRRRIAYSEVTEDGKGKSSKGSDGAHGQGQMGLLKECWW